MDDSPTVRRFVTQVLQCEGIELGQAENGLIALTRCAERLPDIIFLDWNMPVMSGIEFLRALRKTEHGTHPRIIFCTTVTDVSRVREAFETGADQYLMKPFDRAGLQEVLQRATEEWRREVASRT